jgi:hypothetical protein
LIANAQNQTQNPYAGNFEVIKTTSKGQEHINVNYVLQPAPFTKVLVLDMNTPDPMKLSVKIVNSAGAVVANWMPDQVNSTYQKQFDISSFAVGKYSLDIYGDDGKKLKSVAFEKANQ